MNMSVKLIPLLFILIRQSKINKQSNADVRAKKNVIKKTEEISNEKKKIKIKKTLRNALIYCCYREISESHLK